jgi:hypothetical protein
MKSPADLMQRLREIEADPKRIFRPRVVVPHNSTTKTRRPSIGIKLRDAYTARELADELRDTYRLDYAVPARRVPADESAADSGAAAEAARRSTQEYEGKISDLIQKLKLEVSQLRLNLRDAERAKSVENLWDALFQSYWEAKCKGGSILWAEGSGILINIGETKLMQWTSTLLEEYSKTIAEHEILVKSERQEARDDAYWRCMAEEQVRRKYDPPPPPARTLGLSAGRKE